MPRGEPIAKPAERATRLVGFLFLHRTSDWRYRALMREVRLIQALETHWALPFTLTEVVLALTLAGGTGCAPAPGSQIVTIQAPGKPVAELKETGRSPRDLQIRGLLAATLSPRVAPANWPKGLAYRPRRNFGPFFSGSDFLSVKVLMNGQAANVFYGQFLVTHPDADLFKRYYGPSLPNTDVSWSSVPGRFPPCSQGSPATTNNIVLALTRVRWRARYGGSIELLFRSQEDFEGELCYQGVTWDLGSLEMRVYVTPTTTVLNGAIQSPQSANVVIGSVSGIELTTSNETAYDASRIALSDPTASGTLARALADLSKSLLTSSNQHPLLLDATRFAYGFLNSQFQDDLGPLKVVDTIEISDDFLQLKTHVGQPYVRLEVRIFHLHWDGAEDMNVEIWTFWDPNSYAYSSDVTIPGVSDGEATGYHTTMLWPLRVCNPSLPDASFFFDVHDGDAAASKLYDLRVFNCSELQARYAANKFGVINEWHVSPVWLRVGDETQGWLSAYVRLSMNLQ